MGTPEVSDQITGEVAAEAMQVLQSLMSEVQFDYELPNDYKLVFEPVVERIGDAPIYCRVKIEAGGKHGELVERMRIVDEVLAIFIQHAKNLAGNDVSTAKTVALHLRRYFSEGDLEIDASTYKADLIFEQLKSLGSSFMLLGGDTLLSFTKSEKGDSCLVTLGMGSDTVELDLNQDLISTFIASMRAAENEAFKHCSGMPAGQRKGEFLECMKTSLHSFHEVLAMTDQVGEDVTDVALVD